MEDIVVSFVIIALNAEKTIDKLFECLRNQDYPHGNIEVILVDGMSNDNTKEIMASFKEESNGFKRVVIMDNPGKTLPCGWNIALQELKGDAVLRVDAHTEIPDNFISLNVYDLKKGESICGGKVISVPADNTRWSIALNEAENSMFGGSFAAFRHAENTRYVSTAAFAIYRKEVFDKVGFYNELLTRTEDNEMHYRMKKAGYRFFYDPAIISYRKTRATLKDLLKQKYLNGYWIGRTMEIQPKCFSLYHFVPFCFVLAIVVAILLAVIKVQWPLILLLVTYGIANIIMTITAVVNCKYRNAVFILLPILFFLLHVSYGTGTIVGLLSIITHKMCRISK